ATLDPRGLHGGPRQDPAQGFRRATLMPCNLCATRPLPGHTRTMEDFTITPWKRYGHDRAYANATDEAKAPLAYIDLATRRVTIPAPCDEPSVTAALVAWAEENRRPAPAESGTSSPARTSEELADLPEGTTAEDIRADETSFEEWLDLADRSPGTYA